jgi:hypothetical protein
MNKKEKKKALKLAGKLAAAATYVNLANIYTLSERMIILDEKLTDFCTFINNHTENDTSKNTRLTD